MSFKLSESEKDFIERRGLMSEADGQTRIIGRIWALLMIVGEPISSAQIAELLEISRGSVSTNLKMLDLMEIIERKAKAGTRETFFAMRDQPYSSLIKAYAKRIRENRKMVEAAVESVERPEARKQLQDLCKFYEVMEAGNKAMIAELEALD